MIVWFVVFIALAVVFNVFGGTKNDVAWFCGAFGIAFLMAAIYLGLLLFSEKPERKPMPIDVYRGKTTLEITCRDGIPVDTIVIWKEEEE